MTQAFRGVLKGSQVRLVEPQRIAQPAPGSGARRPAGPAARIVRQEDGEVVVEVVCECGRVIHLHCAYGEQPPTPRPNA